MEFDEFVAAAATDDAVTVEANVVMVIGCCVVAETTIDAMDVAGVEDDDEFVFCEMLKAPPFADVSRIFATEIKEEKEKN